MQHWMDLILILLIAPNFVFLGASRLQACIKALAFQCILLGIFPLIGQREGLTLHVVTLAAVMIVLKGIMLPRLLDRAMRKADVRREVVPFIGFGSSIAAGIVLLAISFWLSSRLPLPDATEPSLAVTVAFFNIFVGLFLLVTRKLALTQVLGYLVMENGIYIFGVALALDTPVLVELGILLDVFVAVFVMGIVIFHISRTFDHIDTDQLSSLKE